MKTRLSGIFFLFFLVSTVVSCRQSGKSGSDERNDSISLAEIKPLVHRFDTMGEGLPIFYNMYLSVEMSSLFETAGAVFEPELLNSLCSKLPAQFLNPSCLIPLIKSRIMLQVPKRR